MNFKRLKTAVLTRWFSETKFKIVPYRHQLISIAFALKNRMQRVAFYHDIGTGKTAASLMLLQCYTKRYGKQRTLVVFPNAVSRTWKKEIPKVTDFTFHHLTGTKQQRLTDLARVKADVFLINYEGLKTIAGKKRTVINRYGNQIGRYQKDSRTAAGYGFTTLIFDECHAFANPWSLQTRIACAFSKAASQVILMSGTPFERSTLGLFGSDLVMDGGKAFGTDYLLFRQKYFFQPHIWAAWVPKHICQVCNQPFSYKRQHLFGHGLSLQQYHARFPERDVTVDDVLLGMIASKSIRYSLEECVDLPRATFERRVVEATPAQVSMMDDILSEIPIRLLNDVNVEGYAQQLLEITGGFLMEKGKVLHEFENNPKLDELLRILFQMKGKVIIYHYYVQEGRIIAAALRKHGLSYAQVRGEIKDKEAELERFQSSAACRFLIAQPRSGGVGLNLQFCHWVIYYSCGYMGTILRKQTEGRIRRAGQTHKQIFIDLIMKDTPDEVIYNSLSARQSHVNGLLDWLRKHGGRSRKPRK